MYHGSSEASTTYEVVLADLGKGLQPGELPLLPNPFPR